MDVLGPQESLKIFSELPIIACDSRQREAFEKCQLEDETLAGVHHFLSK